jgi:tetratricopeptide (TPR) repeat protein
MARPPCATLCLLCAMALLGPVSMPAQAESPAGGRAPTEAPLPLTFPAPDLSRLEPVVRRRLSEAHAGLMVRLQGSAVPDAALGEAFGELGRLYHAHFVTEPALTCYLAAQRLQPAAFRWPYLLGFLYQQTSQLEPALGSFRRALGLRPEDPAARLRLAQVYLELNRPQQARELFQGLLAVEGMRAAAAAGLGKVALSQRRYAEAVDWLGQALAAQPQARRLNYPLAMAYRGLGEVDKARQRLKGEDEGQPAFPDPLVEGLKELAGGVRTHVRRAKKAVDEGQLEQAIEELHTALEIDPDNVAARIALARVLYETGDLEGVRQHLSQVLAREPANARANFFMGLMAERSGDEAGAMSDFRRALETDPEHPGAHFHLAHALMRARDYRQAAQHYHKVVEYAPYNRVARLMEAVAWVRAGPDHRVALSRMEEAVAAYPDDPMLSYALARLLAASPDDAVRDAQRALGLAQALYSRYPVPENVETLAMAYAGSGDFDKAVSQQQQAITMAMSFARFEIVPRLEANLQRYRQRQPCRDPWTEDDPLFQPHRSTPASPGQKAMLE